MGFQKGGVRVLGRLYVAWFFVFVLGFLLVTLVVAPFVRWSILNVAWEYSFGWHEVFRILGYSAGLAAPASALMWIEGRFEIAP